MICPRCSREVDERFYGPCSDCRAFLRREIAHPVFARPQFVPEVEPEEVLDVAS